MGSPQLENGYTRIANELLDALVKTRIPGEERQVFDFILRQTYGFQQKKAAIGTFQFEKATLLPRRAIEKARKNLKEKKIIKIITGSTIYNPNTYEINKHHKEWILPPKRAVPPKKGADPRQKDGQRYRQKDGTVKKERNKETNFEPETEGRKAFQELTRKLAREKGIS